MKLVFLAAAAVVVVVVVALEQSTSKNYANDLLGKEKEDFYFPSFSIFFLSPAFLIK